MNSLLEDLNLLSLIKLSTLFNDEENGLLRDLYGLLRHFMYFSIDDHTGAQYSRTQSYEAHCAKLARLQRTALKHFKSKLTILALSNYGTVEQRTDLENHLEALSDAELSELCTLLGYRTSYPSSTKIAVDRTFVMEVLVSGHEIRKTFQEVVKDLNIMPTEVGPLKTQFASSLYICRARYMSPLYCATKLMTGRDRLRFQSSTFNT